MLTIPVGSVKETIDRIPNICPICHHAIDARYLTAAHPKSTISSRPLLDAVFQCPHKECLRIFIGRYSGERNNNVIGYFYKVTSTLPHIPTPPTHHELVAKLSPSFVSIFSEAARAEAWGLGEIAGGGYRKALEFLVKDYCIAQNPALSAAIRAKMLGPVIADHISDENIKQCARRATWLGNDETHYERRWTTRDITDLKALIALTESWVGTHLLTQKYLSEMPDAEK